MKAMSAAFAALILMFTALTARADDHIGLIGGTAIEWMATNPSSGGTSSTVAQNGDVIVSWHKNDHPNWAGDEVFSAICIRPSVGVVGSTVKVGLMTLDSESRPVDPIWEYTFATDVAGTYCAEFDDSSATTHGATTDAYIDTNGDLRLERGTGVAKVVSFSTHNVRPYIVNTMHIRYIGNPVNTTTGLPEIGVQSPNGFVFDASLWGQSVSPTDLENYDWRTPVIALVRVPNP